MNFSSLVHARHSISAKLHTGGPGAGRLDTDGAASECGVIIATVNRPEGDTGVHAHTRALGDGFTRAGIPYHVISPFTGTSMWSPIFAVRPLVLDRLNKTWSTRWYRHWHLVALRDRLRAWLARHPAAAVIAQCPLSARAALDVRREFELDFPIATVCHFNHSEAREYREKGELADENAFQAILDLEVDVLQRVDTVIYPSEWSRDAVEVTRGIVPRSAAVIRNGIPASVPTSPVSRTEFGLSPADVVLVNVGSLEARKNQLGLLDLFAVIARHHSPARLLLVGDGPQRTEIEARIVALGLTEKVKCLGFRADVPAVFGAADLYVHYAKVENCPVILLEAARARLPIATVPAGGAAEVLNALGAGIILDPDNIHASLKVLQPLLTSTAARSETGREVHEGFIEQFTQDAMVNGYVDHLRSIGAKIESNQSPGEQRREGAKGE